MNLEIHPHKFLTLFLETGKQVPHLSRAGYGHGERNWKKSRGKKEERERENRVQNAAVHSSEWIEDTGETEREREKGGERKKVTRIGRNKRPKQKEKNGTRACESEWMQRGRGRRKEAKKRKKEGEEEQVRESEGGGSESARLDRVAPSQRAKQR